MKLTPCRAALPLIPLLSLCTFGCAHNALVGTWKGRVTAPKTEAFGEALLEFTPEGKFSEVIETPNGTVSGIGTYTNEGDHLTIRSLNLSFDKGGVTLGGASEGQSLTLHQEDDNLKIEQGGGTLILHRVTGNAK